MKQYFSKNNSIKYLIYIAIFTMGVIVFKDPLMEAVSEMGKIRITQIIGILLIAVFYQFVDGLNLTILSRFGNHKLKLIRGQYGMLVTSFFRVITFGSGAGVTTIAYLAKEKYTVSEGTGISAINYMLHKIIIAFLCLVLMLFSFSDVQDQYKGYFQYLILSLVVVVLIVLAYLFLCISKKLHKIIINILSLFNRKGKHNEWIVNTKNQFEILETAAKELLSNPFKIALILVLDCLKLLAWYSIPYVLFHGTISIGYLEAITKMAFVVAIAGVIPAPAGIGSTLFAFLLIFTGVAPQENLLSVVLLYRFATFIFPGLLGGISIIGVKLVDNP